jgi:hypothetical protein
MDVLSFDCGLRNLAAAVVRIVPGFAFPPECRVYASTAETAEQFKERAMGYFVRHAWSVVAAQLIDVSEYLGRDTRVKQVKKLGLMSKARGIYAVLEQLEAAWFRASAADIVAVEIQHGANAEMRAVSLAIPVFFMRSMVDAEFVGVVGGQKLKICDAVGVHLGDGTAFLGAAAAAKKAAKAAARKGPVRKKKAAVVAAAANTKPLTALFAAVPPTPLPTSVVVIDESSSSDDEVEAAPRYNPYAKVRFGRGGGAGSGSGSGAARDKYEDNKGRALAAMAVIVTADAQRVCGASPGLMEAIKDPNVADAILQGVWVLWTQHAPRAPARRKAKTDAGAAPTPPKKLKTK